MPIKGDGEQEQKSAKVLKLGLNISLSGDPGTDFEIVLDEDGQKAVQSSVKDEIQSQAAGLPEQERISNVPSCASEEVTSQRGTPSYSTGAIPKRRKSTTNMSPSDSSVGSEVEKSESKDSGIIDQIKSTMEHFEKFSDHIKEIPRLRNHPIATSTPFSHKSSSKSESNLAQAEYKPRKFAQLYDFKYRKEYFKSSSKPPDLFLKPLPGENYYKRGIYTRYFDLDPYRLYGSDNSLNKTSDNRIVCARPRSDERYEMCSLPSDQPTGILKKFDGESGDKQSTSSAESIKDIKIYQSGGILIMQNFKENLDSAEKKEMSDFSMKLIENCNRLREEISSFQTDRIFESSSDENKNLGKTVQFDLTSTDGQKSKSDSSCAALKDESSFLRMESSESTSDGPKIKDTSPQGTSQSQDFPSLSTQENDSLISNQPGTSPTFVSPKKLEWDSGADIGYLNLDLTKENLSTIERIVLKGLSSDGQSEKDVVYEKKPAKQNSRSKFILERIPSDLKIENGLVSGSNKSKEKDPFVLEDKEEKKPSGFEGAREKKSGTTKEVSRDDNYKLEESKPRPEGLPISKTDKTEQEKESLKKRKTFTKTDKSVNVNTLWEDLGNGIPLCQNTGAESLGVAEQHSKVRGRKFSPKVKKLKKKKSVGQKMVPLRDDSPMGEPLKVSDLELSLQKNKAGKMETASVLKGDAELSKETEEIIVDQRFHTKQEEGKASKETPASEVAADDKSETKTNNKVKSRPISASSGSNNTVLPKSAGEKSNRSSESKFMSQIIQTSDVACESVGVQAFSSRVSSDCDFKSNEPKEATKGPSENVNTSSKNIQAFGLNASLPKQLEHPKESTELTANQNTKSTQYFGGPVNSLPNYHANLVTKPGESCGRAPQVLKAKKNLEAEIIRLKEENEKNILANDAPKLDESKADSRKRNRNENKENIRLKTSANSKRSQSSASRKTSKGNGLPSQDSDKKESEQPDMKEKSQSREGSECLQTSDEVSSVVLTSEVLKEHGDSIDRNIIQEKYFQSQMAEFELRKMVSRSTSMEIQAQNEGDKPCKKYTSTACQYSPQSKEAFSGERAKSQDCDSSKGKPSRQGRTTSEQYDSSQNMAEECCETLQSTNLERGLGAGDSLPSSTQTAHSWVPGQQNPGENASGVGRARSFEYLPGHIYESSGNLREELPSETEQNLITSSSSDSDTAKRSLSDRAGESEGRHTLVLENSTESSCESDRLKTLDGNLTQLNFAVSKLREKDAQVQSITRSLLANLWKKNGSGDCLTLDGVHASKPEVANNSRELSWSGKDRGDTPLDTSGDRPKQHSKEREVSIACQTEEKSSSSDHEKFYEERKALEKRISEEKRCQIKWIENEIRHLNVLRGLLEKQNHAKNTKKKHSPTPMTSNDDESRSGGNVSPEAHPRPVTPVYGCTISVSENVVPEIQHTHSQPRDRQQGPQHWCQYSMEEPSQYGMAVSLSGKDKSKSWRRVVMLPVGVQVSLKDTNFLEDCVFEETGRENESSSRRQHSPKSYAAENVIPHNPCRYSAVAHSDVNTQYPSARKAGNFPSISVQTSFSSNGKCCHCNEENCVCINLEKSYSSLSRSTRSRTSERRGSSKLTSLSEEPEFEDNNQNKTNEPKDNFKKFVESESDSPGNQSKSKSIYGHNCKCVNAGDDYKSELPDNHDRQEPIQNSDCRFPNCPVQVSSNSSKQDFSCRCPCQSNVYLNIDKPSRDFGTCCSKAQSQKMPNPSCHIIKIQGPKCCPPGKNSCCCKSKKTENQSCQTDVVKIVPEDSSSRSDLSYEKRPSGDAKPCRQSPDANMSERAQHPSCGCRRKPEEKKTPPSDHPRHYFLRIEEKEIEDDSNEPTEQRKSLEVITVTVPVKKVGRAKIIGSTVQEARESYQKKARVLDSSTNVCNCCSECIAHRLKPTKEYQSRGYQRSVAEKPQSPPRDCTPYLKHYSSRETANTYAGMSYQSKELPSPEYYTDRRLHSPEAESHCSRANGSHAPQSRESRHSSRRNSAQDVQSEYDSHKKSRSGNIKEYCEDGSLRVYESRRNSEKQRRTPPSERAERRNCDSRDHRQDGLSPAERENGRWGYDYYNYNKREFMTKSELLKEEEQQRQAHQPSLQEYLSSNRPDFYHSAERRRQIISERARERVKKHTNRMECLINLIHRCNEREQASSKGPQRIFTTAQMREETMKRYKKLPEVTGKLAERKKKEEYRTNKLMADIFAKKLQCEALKGHLNLSNSVALLHTI